MQLTTMKPVLIGALLTLFALPAAANENNSARRSTSAIPRTKILEISDQIDAIVAAQLSSKSQELNPLSSDEVFLRRAYLDIVGRIPSIDETQRFLKSSSKNKLNPNSSQTQQTQTKLHTNSIQTQGKLNPNSSQTQAKLNSNSTQTQPKLNPNSAQTQPQ